MNNIKPLENELIVERSRPVRNEPYIAWLDSVRRLAIYANKKMAEKEVKQ